MRLMTITGYFSHIREVLKKAGIGVTEENKRDLDRVIHGIVGVEHKNCPTAWREVKKRLARNPEAFISELRKEWNKRI